VCALKDLKEKMGGKGDQTGNIRKMETAKEPF
jgi:hypothetical protein